MKHPSNPRGNIFLMRSGSRISVGAGHASTVTVRVTLVSDQRSQVQNRMSYMSLKVWWESLRTPAELQTFGNKQVEEWIGDSPSDELIEELSSFGDLMVAEVTSTTS